MAMMALHEDSPLSEYVYFPIVNLDAEVLQTLGASFTWSPVGDDDDRIFRFSLTNDSLYTAIGANMPRQRSSSGCIMQNRNVWENVQGVFERSDTVMMDIEVGTKPDDFDSNIHYMTLTTQTIDDQAYNIYNIKNRGNWSAADHYYLDDSTPENRHTRLFFADGGLSFGVFNALQYSTSIVERYRKFTGFAQPFPASSIGSNVVFPLYWGYNGSTFNPNASTGSGAMNATNWAPTRYVDGSQYVDEQQNYVTFFAHIRLNNVDYYGAAVAKMSADASDAYPQAITCCMWAAEYWGTSIIAGGDIPEGQWGPSSDQSGGTGGSWDYTGESIPDTDATMLPAAFVSGSVIKCYAITDANLNHLAERLYNTDSSLWTAWSNKMYSPASALIALHYLPAEFSGSYDSSNLSRVSMAGQSLDTTGTYQAVNGYLQTAQWRDSPIYTLSVPKIADSFVDMAPYTRMTLHLPFCGAAQIDPARCTGGSITVRYRCDAMTGNVSARITLTDRFGASTVMMALGNCAYAIPIMGKTGGAAGAALAGGVIGALGMVLTGNFAGAAAAAAGGVIADYSAQATQAQQIQRTGDTSPLLDLCLWLEISRAIPSTPDDKQALQGVPANVTRTLVQLEHTGFVRCSDVHLQIDTATEGEIQEIDRLLRSGIILQ